MVTLQFHSGAIYGELTNLRSILLRQLHRHGIRL